MTSKPQAAQFSGSEISSNVIPTKNYWPIAVAIGVILTLGSVFLFLAANQILPHGVNAISDLGIWGQALGCSGSAIGTSITSVGAILWYFKNTMPVIMPLPEKSSIWDTSPMTRYETNDHLRRLIEKSIDALPPANYYFWGFGAARKQMGSECKTFIESCVASNLPTVVVILISSISAPDNTRSQGVEAYKERYPHLNCVEFVFNGSTFDPNSELNRGTMEKLKQIVKDFHSSK